MLTLVIPLALIVMLGIVWSLCAAAGNADDRLDEMRTERVENWNWPAKVGEGVDRRGVLSAPVRSGLFSDLRTFYPALAYIVEQHRKARGNR